MRGPRTTKKRLKTGPRRLSDTTVHPRTIVPTLIRCLTRSFSAPVPIVTTKNVCDRRALIRTLTLKTDKIRVNAQFVPARRYSTSHHCGRFRLQTAPTSVILIRDPIKLPNQTLHGTFIRRITTKTNPSPGRNYFTGYLRIYGFHSHHRACYVLQTLSQTYQNSIRGKLIFTNGDIKRDSHVIPITRLVARLMTN